MSGIVKIKVSQIFYTHLKVKLVLPKLDLYERVTFLIYTKKYNNEFVEK